MVMNCVDTTELSSFEMGKLKLRPFAGDQLMILRVEGPKGGEAPPHSHPHEQISLVLSGKLLFCVDGETREVFAGEAVHIPSNATHSAQFLEDSLVIDIYHPVRDDMIARVAG